MDQELKQRLIGAAVVTALAAIFIPMLFDDPVNDSGQIVSELTIPKTPVTAIEDTANKLPANAAEVAETPKTGALSANMQNPLEYTEQQSEPMDELQWVEESGAVDDPDVTEIHSTENPVSENKPLTAKTPQSTPVNSNKKTVQAQTKSTAATPAATAPKQLSVPKPKTSKTNTALSRWYIQAGSFSKKENATSRLEALRKQGLPVFMETQTTDKGPMYRLKVGPELDKKRAITIRDRLTKQNIKTIIISE